MTCIVGIVHKGIVYMGGDAAGSEDHYLQIRKTPKVFKNGEFLIGYTSSFRMGQLLEHTFEPPTPQEGQDVMNFMVRDFIPEVRDCLLEGGFAKKEHNVEDGGTFLVGYRGRLFEIEDDFQVGENVDDYHAVGCGLDLAKGSLRTTGKVSALSNHPRQRIDLALEAASYHSAWVSGPFTIISSDDK